MNAEIKTAATIQARIKELAYRMQAIKYDLADIQAEADARGLDSWGLGYGLGQAEDLIETLEGEFDIETRDA